MATETTILEFLLSAKDSTSEAFESFHSRLDGIGEHLQRIGETAAGFIGAELFMDAAGGVEKFGESLITSNQNAETFQNTLQALYGNAQQAKDAFAFLTQNEMSAPFDITSIQDAAKTVVGFGGNLQELMNPLEQISSVMGVTLPTAAQALMDAHAGLYRMVERDLHITKEELASTGLVAVDAAGHVTGDLDAAFAAYVGHRYPDALTLQMNTLGGALSSLESQFTYLERELGQGVFNVVKQDVQELTNYMKTNKEEIANYAAVFSNALGTIAVDVFEVAKVMTGALFEAVVIVSNLWGAISGPVHTAFDAIGKIVTAFVNWFQTSALPVIAGALGAMAVWWDDHRTQVETTLTEIWGAVQIAFGYIGTIVADAMQVVGGIIQEAWGIIEAVWTVGSDVITGNFDSFGTDLESAGKNIVEGVLNIFSGLVKGTVEIVMSLGSALAVVLTPLANDMLGVFDKLGHGIHNIWVDIGNFIGGIVGAIVTSMDNLINKVVDGVNKIIDGINSLPSWLPGIGGHHVDELGKLPADAAGAAAGAAVTDFINQHALGLGPNKDLQPTRTNAQAEADVRNSFKVWSDSFGGWVDDQKNKVLSALSIVPDSSGGAFSPLWGAGKQDANQQRGMSILDGLRAAIERLMAPSGGGFFKSLWAPQLPGGGGDAGGNLDVHGGLTGPDLPTGAAGFFSSVWNAMGPQVSTPTPPPEMAGGVDYAVANAASNLLDSLKDDTTEVGGVAYAVANAASNLMDGLAQMQAGPGAAQGLFAGAWAALGPQVADMAQAAAGAAGLKSPTFVGGYDDPGLSAGRGGAAVRLGFVGANDQQKVIAMLEAQVAYLQQQLGLQSRTAVASEEIARNTNPHSAGNAGRGAPAVGGFLGHNAARAF